jgi:hypothetical protein
MNYVVKSGLSNKLDPFVKQFQHGNDVSFGIVGKCVKHLDAAMK